MTDIINQMSEIEHVAGTIVSTAAQKKETIFAEAEDKKKLFDEELAQDVEKRIKNLKESLYAKKDQEMNDLKAGTKKSLKDIQEIYDNQHTALAKQIMNRIVGV